MCGYISGINQYALYNMYIYVTGCTIGGTGCTTGILSTSGGTGCTTWGTGCTTGDTGCTTGGTVYKYPLSSILRYLSCPAKASK